MEEQGILAPVSASERMPALDVLRGFALLGIFLMNIEFFSRPLQDMESAGVDPSLHGIDYAADALVYFFVQSKFWTLFSLLFGMGFAVMIDRAQQAGRSFLATYLRRTLVLLGMGAAHALLVWSGDILVSYAICALVLLLMRQIRRGMIHLFEGRWMMLIVCLILAIFISLAGVFHSIFTKSIAPPVYYSLAALVVFLLPFVVAAWSLWKRSRIEPLVPVFPVQAQILISIGSSLYGLPLALMLIGGALGSGFSKPPTVEQKAEQAKSQAEHAATRAEAVRAYSEGSYAEANAQRKVDTLWQLQTLPFAGIMITGVFVLGAGLVRSGALAQPQAFLPQYRRLRNIGLPLGFGLMAISVSLGTSPPMLDFGIREAMQMVGYLSAGLILALSYGASLVLALQGRHGETLQAWLAPAGRMALSNYLLQSLAGTLIFFHYGLGLWGQVPRSLQVVLVLAVFFLQLLLSRWWLARFRFGPAEWLWRAATYLQLPAMRR